MQQNDDLIFMKNEYDETFLNWVKQSQIVQIITRMNQIIFVRDVITAITRMYQYQNNQCSKNRVNMLWDYTQLSIRHDFFCCNNVV